MNQANKQYLVHKKSQQQYQSQIFEFKEQRPPNQSYSSMVQDEINNRSKQMFEASHQSVRSNSRQQNKRRGRSVRKEQSIGRVNQNSISPKNQTESALIDNVIQQPSIIDQFNSSLIDEQITGFQSTRQQNEYNTNINLQLSNIHYGVNGKFIDVKSPCMSGKVSQFINYSINKSQQNDTIHAERIDQGSDIIACEFNTSDFNRYIKDIEKNDHQVSRNSPTKLAHANTLQDTKQDYLFTDYCPNLQVSRFILPDNVMSPPLDNFQTCLSQPQLVYSKNQGQPASMLNGVNDLDYELCTPDQAFGSSNGVQSDQKSKKSKSNKSKTKKSRRKSKQFSKVSEDFEFGGSFFNPDCAQIPHGQNEIQQSSSSYDDQVTKSAKQTKRKKIKIQKNQKEQHLSQFILSPGSQKYKEKKPKSKKKINLERIHSEANEQTQSQLDQILMSPDNYNKSEYGSKDNQFTFNTQTSKMGQSKSKSKRKSKTKKKQQTFGPEQQIGPLSLQSNDNDTNEKIESNPQPILHTQPDEDDTIQHFYIKKNHVSRTNKNSPKNQNLAPIKPAISAQKKQTKQNIQSRLLGNIINTPIRRKRANRFPNSSSQQNLRICTNDSEYMTAEEAENINSGQNICKTGLSKNKEFQMTVNKSESPNNLVQKQNNENKFRKQHSSKALFKIESEQKTNILQYGKINLNYQEYQLQSPESKLQSSIITPTKPGHVKNQLSSSKMIKNIQSPYTIKSTSKSDKKQMLNKYGSQKLLQSGNKHQIKKSMPNIPEDKIMVEEIVLGKGEEKSDTRQDKNDPKEVIHKRMSSNIQDYIQNRANLLSGSVLGQQSQVSAPYKPKPQASKLHQNFSQRLIKKQGVQKSQTITGLTLSSGALSGTLSTVNKSGTMYGGLKTCSTQQAIVKGNGTIKQSFNTSKSKKNLNELESGGNSGSLEEKETACQRSKNSSNSFKRNVSDNFKFKDNISGKSGREASLENILEQEDDIMDLQMSKDSLNGQEDVSLQQVDIQFKQQEEDPLNNLRQNCLRNSKTVNMKQKIDKKYTSTKTSLTNALISSISKKNTSGYTYQIPVARKSQFRNKRPSDSTNVPVQVMGSLKKPQSSFNQDLEIGSPAKILREMEKSASKPGGLYAQQLLIANRQDSRNRVRTQVRSGIQNQTMRDSNQLNDQLLLERQKELQQNLKLNFEQKYKEKELTKMNSSNQVTGQKLQQTVRNNYSSRPGTALQEQRDPPQLKNNEKVQKGIQTKKENKISTLGSKKQSIQYNNSNQLIQTKTSNEDLKTNDVDISGIQSSKARTGGTSFGKLGITRNGSQNRQPNKTYGIGSQALNIQSTNMTNNYAKDRISTQATPANQKLTPSLGLKPYVKINKTPITAPMGGTQNKTAVVQNKYLLLDSEKEKYGDRCPPGFKKLSLLGKGGIALVWLAEMKNSNNQNVALKQFPKTKGQSLDNSAKIEIDTLSTLFPPSNNDDNEFSYALDPIESPGIKSIARLIDQIDDKQDFWLVYEVGSKCLGKQLAEVKGEFYKGERIYHVAHQGFYKALARNNQILATLIRKIAEIFDVLSQFGIVHSDIKPDNILIKLNDYGTDIEDLKLIDFGSAFQFHNVTQITATTPEYLAPEILDYLDQRNKNQKSNLASAVSLSKTSQPWSFDVWSLGIILLEIISGFPIWMSLKCRVSTVTGKSLLGSGLLGVQGREGKRILAKQQQILKNLVSTIRKFECYGLDQNSDFMDLLGKMLDTNASRRISPQDIIDHPFCCQQ